MEWMNKLIILIAICVLWFWSFLLLPKTGEKVVYLYHFLALCGLVMIYFALVDPEMCIRDSPWLTLRPWLT